MYGQASAIVEPIAGVLGAWAVLTFEPILPYALAFAAGAMIFVVVEEVIPETQQDKYTDIATMGFIGGFIIMMTLDVGLSWSLPTDQIKNTFGQKPIGFR